MIEIKIIGTFTKLAAKIREFQDKPANSNWFKFIINNPLCRRQHRKVKRLKLFSTCHRLNQCSSKFHVHTSLTLPTIVQILLTVITTFMWYGSLYLSSLVPFVKWSYRNYIWQRGQRQFKILSIISTISSFLSVLSIPWSYLQLVLDWLLTIECMVDLRSDWVRPSNLTYRYDCINL